MRRVLHIIVGLERGGAEVMLQRLIFQQQIEGEFEHAVVSLQDGGRVSQSLVQGGIHVEHLGVRTYFSALKEFPQLVRIIRRMRPDIVQTWMYHADLIGGIAARLAGVKSIVWGIRCTSILNKYSVTGLVTRVCAALSYWLPSAIVCCADAAKRSHSELGYCRRKLLTIPNGYDRTAVRLTRTEVREKLGVTTDDVLVGVVGRFDPLKDYRNFLAAAQLVSQDRVDIKWLMVGRGLDSNNEKLNAWIVEFELTEKVVLVGETLDVRSYLNAMDVFVLPSRSEGFPNVLCEAMASKLPCVATDVGDVALVLDGNGELVKAEDHIQLAEGITKILALTSNERHTLGLSACRRIEENYSISAVSAKYREVYESVLGT